MSPVPFRRRGMPGIQRQAPTCRHTAAVQFGRRNGRVGRPRRQRVAPGGRQDQRGQKRAVPPSAASRAGNLESFRRTWAAGPICPISRHAAASLPPLSVESAAAGAADCPDSPMPAGGPVAAGSWRRRMASVPHWAHRAARSAPAAKLDKASATAAGVANRDSGSLLNIRSTTAAKAAGTSLRRRRIGGAGRSSRATIRFMGVTFSGSSNGVRPASSLYRAQPKL